MHVGTQHIHFAVITFPVADHTFSLSWGPVSRGGARSGRGGVGGVLQ